MEAQGERHPSGVTKTLIMSCAGPSLRPDRPLHLALFRLARLWHSHGQFQATAAAYLNRNDPRACVQRDRTFRSVWAETARLKLGL
jgi:hypothetical protein